MKIEGAALRAVCEVDCRLGYGLMQQLSRAVAERLHFARLQLAAARV